MVNRLSNLAEFLETDSLPSWLKEQLESRHEEISAKLARGESVTIKGPNDETVTIAPKPAAAVA